MSRQRRRIAFRELRPSRRPRLRLLVAVGTVLLGAGLTWWLAPRAKDEVAAPAAAKVADPQQQLLLQRLAELRRSWRPDRRAAVLAELREQAHDLAVPLLWLLRQPGHHYLREAALLAGECGLEPCRAPLLRLAATATPEVRAAAIRALGQLGPFDGDELDGWLQDQDPQVVAAAVRVAAGPDQRQLPRVLPLLASPLAEVREAVATVAVPPLHADDLLELRTVAQKVQGEAETAVLAVLGNNREQGEVENLLLQYATGALGSHRAAALRALAKGKAPLQQPEPLLAIALERHEPLELRALALLALEQTRTPVGARLEAALADLDDTLLYLASRCLLTQDAPTGLPGLLRVLAAAEDGTGHQDVVAALALAKEVRRTLALVTRLPIDTPLEDWQRWAQSAGPLHCPPLPEPVLTYEEPLPPAPGR